MLFVYLHLAIFGFWIVASSHGRLPIAKPMPAVPGARSRKSCNEEKLATLVAEIASHVGVRTKVDSELEEIKQDECRLGFRVPRWDELFVVLAMIASVETIFLSTFRLFAAAAMRFG